MQLQSITLREIQMSLVEPFQISSGTASLRRILLLESRDVDGITAWSECVAGEAPYFSPDTIDTAWLAIQIWLGPRVLGTPIAHPGDVLGLSLIHISEPTRQAASSGGGVCLKK